MMNYDFKKLEERSKEAALWLKSEMGSIRTGRATPAILDNVLIDSYGAKMPIKHVAAISVLDPKTLKITPWDTSMVKSIETAVSASSIGVQPVADKDSIRIVLPSLTDERRKILVKLVTEKTEEAKISIRKERDEAWRDIQEKEKAGTVSEDDKYRLKEEMEKIIKKAVESLETISSDKKAEISF